MKIMKKRIAAVALSAALLVVSLLSGLVLPATAQTAENTVDNGGIDALSVFANFSPSSVEYEGKQVTQMSSAPASTNRLLLSNCENIATLAVGDELLVSFRYKGEDGATAILMSTEAEEIKSVMNGKTVNTAPDAEGWRTCRAKFSVCVVDKNYLVSLRFTGTTSAVYVDDVYIGIGNQVKVSDLTWTPNDTQLLTGTGVSVSATVTNDGIRDIDRDITTVFFADDGERSVELGTHTYTGGLTTGETITATMSTPWSALSGEWVISAHTTVAGSQEDVDKSAAQANLRVAGTLLEAPQYAQASGFDKLAFSDDFTTANVDVDYTGDYGYKWYLTHLNGVSGDETDYTLTDDGITLAAQNMQYNWLLGSMDANTGAGWWGFNHGYLEFSVRFQPTCEHTHTDEETKCLGPAIWSFPPQYIAPSVAGTVDRYVEMDWMEYWPSGNWTVTMHDNKELGIDDNYNKIYNKIYNDKSFTVNGQQFNLGNNEWHTVGYSLREGVLTAYLDGTQCFSQTWSKDGSETYPAAYAATGSTLLPDALSPIDNQLNALILGGSASWPLEIDYIRVWTADEDKPATTLFAEQAESTATVHLAHNNYRTLPQAGDNTLYWVSENPSIASVIAGKVYAHHSGTTAVGVYSANKKTLLAHYTVVVDRYGERLPGGDFEVDTEDVGWCTAIVVDGKGEIITEEDGNRVLQMPTGQRGYFYNLNVEAGKTYRFSGRVKGSVNPTAGDENGLIYFNEAPLYDGTSNGKFKQPTAGHSVDEWVDFSYTFTTNSVNADGEHTVNKNYLLSLGNTGGDSYAYFDDLSLVETDGYTVSGIGGTFTYNTYTRKAIFGGCFPTAGQDVYTNYTVTLQSDNTDVLENTSATVLTGRAFGSAHVTVTAVPQAGGETLTATVKVSVVSEQDGVTALNAPHATVSITYPDGTLLTAAPVSGSQVYVQLTPDEGYLPISGSLRYIQENGEQTKLLNRVASITDGTTFAMKVPSGGFAVQAATVSTEKQDFSFDTIATGLHINEESNKIDGVRFLTRLYFDGEFKTNSEGNLQLRYDGEYYDVVSMGTLLKRRSNVTNDLTLEAANATVSASSSVKVWNAKAYTAASNTFHCVDRTDNYIDFAVSMMTHTPTLEFNARVYQARGYVQLKKDGVEKVIYTFTTLSDTVNLAKARYYKMTGTTPPFEDIEGEGGIVDDD